MTLILRFKLATMAIFIPFAQFTHEDKQIHMKHTYLLEDKPYKNIRDHQNIGKIATAHALEISENTWSSTFKVESYIVTLDGSVEKVKVSKEYITFLSGSDDVIRTGNLALSSFHAWYKKGRYSTVGGLYFPKPQFKKFGGIFESHTFEEKP